MRVVAKRHRYTYRSNSTARASRGDAARHAAFQPPCNETICKDPGPMLTWLYFPPEHATSSPGGQCGKQRIKRLREDTGGQYRPGCSFVVRSVDAERSDLALLDDLDLVEALTLN